MIRFVWRDILRNPRRSVAALIGITLGVGMASGLLFFSAGSGATLTRRAIAPLALDMQVMLAEPLGRALRLEERFAAAGSTGSEVAVTITVANEGTVPANEVVVSSEPPAPLTYVPGTTTVEGRPLPDMEGRSVLAQGAARTGHNLGTVPAGATLSIGYRALAPPVVEVRALVSRARISTREDVVPRPANAPPPLTLTQLRDQVAGIPGVMAADRLSYVDLAPGSLWGGGVAAPGPVRIYAFDAGYRERYPSVRLAAGRFDDRAAVVSAEAGRAVGAMDGASVSLALPSDPRPLELPVSGVADLADAKPLFYSRKTSKLEDFLYVPLVVIVSPATFEERVMPAFRATAAIGGQVAKSRPVSEVDVLVDRSRLDADPGRALSVTRRIAGGIDRVAPGQTSVIDNISNTLEVARGDATVGRRMFVFLGVPGILLAVFLTAYAGSILAATQRQEQALLRLRGADGRLLLRALLTKAVALAAVGSAAGTAVGFASAAAVLGRAEMAGADTSDLVASAGAALLAGVLTTATALCVPGARSLRREISQERRDLAADHAPTWRRWRFDAGLVAVAAIGEGIAFATGAFDPPPVSVSEGRAASLPTRLLVAPLGAWAGGTLLAVRLVRGLVSRAPLPRSAGFGSLLRGTWTRSLRRRSWSLATGSVGVGLVTSFGVALAIFAGTYDSAKAADARFTVGADLRAAASVLGLPRPTSEAQKLMVTGVAAVSPVVAVPENAVLFAAFNQDRRDLAAIDPATYLDTAAPEDGFFVDTTADAAMASLTDTPDGLLVGAGTADEFSIEVGETVEVLLARGTDQQALRTLRVVGIFERLPGFPLGIDLVVDLTRYEEATKLTTADFFLLRSDGGSNGVAVTADALRAGPGAVDPLRIETVRTALNKDQSSLTALDVRGLVDLDSLFVVALAAAAVCTFVFGLLLHRRREFVSLRARGLLSGELFALVVAETLVVAIAGVVAGAGVGTLMGWTLVQVLRPLFLLDPTLTIPVVRLLALLFLPIATGGLAALAATALLRRLPPTEVLRDL